MEKEKRKRRKRIYVVMAAVFIGMILLISLTNLLHKDKAFSDHENRALAMRPEISISSLVSGRFMSQYEEYVSDQFVGRNFWVQLKTTADSIGGKKEENGVFNGRDSYLLEDISVPDEEKIKENLNSMTAFSKKYEDVTMQVMLVPNAANILEKKLPTFAVVADQSKMLKEVRSTLGSDLDWIDVEKTMKKYRNEDIYYRTDHHWTTLGAYYAFQDARSQLGLEGKEKVKMSAFGVSNNFNGSLSAVSGYQTGYKEAIYIYLPEDTDAPQVIVNYVEEQKKTASLYDSSKLEERDQYSVFLGGNHALIEIKSTVETGERLLVIKDSYANCFVPFLAPYFREIQVVDPRYYVGGLNKLMEDNDIDRVLFLYNANTFFEDRTLAGVLDATEE